jgi:hypothetical protein
VSPPLIAAWLEIGHANPWICTADDPAFTEASFHECSSVEELRGKLEHGNWCLGQAFTYRDIAFINQVDGGDEWLTIRHGIAFESISWEPIIRRGAFERTLTKLLAATEEECRTLRWTDARTPVRWALHANGAGVWCPWSHCCAMPWFADADDKRCPSRCPGSTIEADPR